VSAIRPHFERLFDPAVRYRATGVVCSGIVDAERVQYDLFGGEKGREADGKVYGAIDKVHGRFGTDSIMLASSLASVKLRSRAPFGAKRFSLPYMGEVA
jgi:hypothetical protein